jgi:integrating conjugative element relaxase (TIGR03760 family)
MFALLRRKTVRPSTGSSSTDAIKGLIRPESATTLLATSRRQKLLEHVWRRTSLSRAQFAMLYLAPIERYASLVQNFPASESHHHTYPGGMLDHGLEIVAYALKLRQSHLLPIGAPPETQVAQAEAWTAGVAYAALLHDIGKIAVDLHVEYADSGIWHPWHGPLQQPYRFRYRKEREYRLHSAATGLLYARMLDREILDWLSGYPDLWSALLYALAGQYEHAGTLGELVAQADQASVAQELGGDPAKALAAPRHALQRKLLDGLRYLLKEELKLNQPQASDGWLTQDALWLVSKTVSDKLRAHLLAQGIDGIPTSNTAVFNVLQDHGIAQTTPDGKAIWKATVTSDAGWSHSFTFLKLAPALIWQSGERPTPFAGTVQVEQDTASESTHSLKGKETITEADVDAPANSAGTLSPPLIPSTAEAAMDGVDALLGLFSAAEMQISPTVEGAPPAARVVETDAASAETTSAATPISVTPTNDEGQVSGKHFMAWLKRSIQTRKLIINDAKALVHTVAGTAYLVSPGVFQRYAQEHPQVTALAKPSKLPEWQWMQKQFEKLGMHRKQGNGLNIWTCEVVGPRKSRRLHGYLLSDPTELFDETPFDNPYLRLSDEAHMHKRS